MIVNGERYSPASRLAPKLGFRPYSRQFYGFKRWLLNPLPIIRLQRRGSIHMVGALSVASVVAGAVLAHWAKYDQSRTEVLETCAGALLIFGFGLLGFVLPHLS